MISPILRLSSFTSARVINFKFSLQPNQKYYIAQCEELGFSELTQMKDNYTTNSHSLTCTVLFDMLGECTFFNLGVKQLKSTHSLK